MTGVLLDSDVLIEVLRARNAPLVAAWNALQDGSTSVFVSPVTVAEIWHGLRPEEQEPVTALFSALASIAIDAPVGRRAGEYLRQFHKSHGVMLGDALLAATASVHGLHLWTRNRRHYPMKDVSFFLTAG